MKKTKRALSLSLSIIMVLTMVLGAMVLPAGAATVNVGDMPATLVYDLEAAGKAFVPGMGEDQAVIEFELEMDATNFTSDDVGKIVITSKAAAEKAAITSNNAKFDQMITFDLTSYGNVRAFVDTAYTSNANARQQSSQVMFTAAASGNTHVAIKIVVDFAAGTYQFYGKNADAADYTKATFSNFTGADKSVIPFKRTGTAADYSTVAMDDISVIAALAQNTYFDCNFVGWTGMTISTLSAPSAAISYNGNGNTGGTAPTGTTVEVGTGYTVLGFGDLEKTDSVFNGWNTKADGTGITYGAGATLTPATTDAIILYAQWKAGTGSAIIQNPGIKLTTLPTAIEPGASGKLIAEFDMTITPGGDNWIGFTSTDYAAIANADKDNQCSMTRIRYNDYDEYGSGSPRTLFISNDTVKNGTPLIADYNDVLDVYPEQSVKIIFDFDTQKYTVYMKSTNDASAEYVLLAKDFGFWNYAGAETFELAKMTDIKAIYATSAPVTFTNMIIREYDPVEVKFMDSDTTTVKRTFSEEAPYDITIPDDTGLTVPAGSGAFKGWVLSTDPGDESTLVTAGSSEVITVAAIYLPVWEASTANNPPEALATVPTMYVEVSGTVTFTADDIATDADLADTLEITDIVTDVGGTYTTSDLTAGVITITGVAVGTDSIEVEVSDGTDVVNVTVPIEVTTFYTISGAITYDLSAATADQDVSYTVNGGAAKTATFDFASALYTLTDIPDGAVVVISVEDVVGYVTPADVTVTIAAADETGADFDYVTETFDITGTVSGLDDVENIGVYYNTDGTPDIATDANVLTDVNGEYTITGIDYGTELTIYAEDIAGFVTPDAVVIASLEADTDDVDFEYIALFTVSGTITVDGDALDTKVITYKIDDGADATVTTDVDGKFTIIDIVDGSKLEITDIDSMDLTKYTVTGDLVIAAVTADVTDFDVDLEEIVGFTISGTLAVDGDAAWNGTVTYTIDGGSPANATVTAGAFSIFVDAGSDLVIQVPAQYNSTGTLAFDDVAADDATVALVWTTKTFTITINTLADAVVNYELGDGTTDFVTADDAGVALIENIKYGTKIEVTPGAVVGYNPATTDDDYDFTSLDDDKEITFVYAPITYTVSWVDGSGTNLAIADDTVAYGGVAVSKVISRSGYNLSGWYTDVALTTEWNFATVVTGDMTLYARWTRRTTDDGNTSINPIVPSGSFTVSFNTQGGSAVASVIVVRDGSVTKPADPTKEGFVFDGWYKDAACTIAWDFAADKITNTTTIYAKWTAEGDVVEGPVEDQPPVVNPDASYEIKEGAASIAYVQGRPDKTFGPDANVSRAEAVTMLYRLMSFEGLDGRASFNDDNMWAQEAIRAFAEAGIVNGISATQFAPDSNITRGQFATILARLMGLDVDAATGTANDISGHWAAANIAAVIEAGYMGGYPDGSFRPDQAMTRAEMVVTINRMLGAEVPEYGADANEFTDISPNHWAYNDICKATGK